MQKETVTVFTGHGCGTCISVKRALKEKKIRFEEKNIHDDPDAFEYMTQKLGYKSVPVIETDSDHWAGLDERKISLIK